MGHLFSAEMLSNIIIIGSIFVLKIDFFIQCTLWLPLSLNPLIPPHFTFHSDPQSFFLLKISFRIVQQHILGLS